MVTMNAQTLTERQKGLAACACLMAQGNMERLETAVETALDDGVTVNELKETFSQALCLHRFPTLAECLRGIEQGAGKQTRKLAGRQALDTS